MCHNLRGAINKALRKGTKMTAAKKEMLEMFDGVEKDIANIDTKMAETQAHVSEIKKTIEDIPYMKEMLEKVLKKLDEEKIEHKAFMFDKVCSILTWANLFKVLFFVAIIASLLGGAEKLGLLQILAGKI